MEKVKLDKTDRKLLAELDKNCRISNTQLAKKVHKSREAVKYRIQQLQQRGILQGFITSINPSNFGYQMFKVYLQLENVPEELEKFYKELKANKDIHWVGISDGVFDCVFAILSRNTTEYFSKINRLLSRWQHLIVNKVLGTMVDTTQYNKKFFIESEPTAVIFGGEPVDNEIDAIDKKILDVLANDARIPLTKLAKKANITIDIAKSKIKKLEKKEIILAYRIAVDFNKLNLEFYKLIIYFRSLSEKDEKSLFEWMERHPNSLYYIRSLAPWEVEFEFAVESYQQFNSIVKELRKKFPHVIKNHEHLIMSEEHWMPAHIEITN